jgi:hypothetical protein
MAGFIFPGGTAGRPGVVYTSEINPLGTIARASDGKEYVFLKGVANVVAGSWVTYDEDGVTTLIDTDVAASCKGPVAVASAAIDSTSEYGWFQISGEVEAVAISGGAAADNAIVYATATAGAVDDVAIANMQIVGAVFRSAEGASVAGFATVQLNHPWIGVDEAAA